MSQENVFSKLLDNGLTIAFAESMTGGALTYELVRFPNASKVVIGSIVAYHKQLKIDLLDVSEHTILKHSLVSKEVAYEMAQGIYKKTNADICIAITGNAGPSLEEGTKDSIAYYTILINKEPKHFYIELNEDSREKNIFLAIEDIYKNLFKMI